MAGRDVSSFTTGLIAHLRSVLMMKAMGMQGAALLELGEEEARELLEQAGHIPAEQLTWLIEQLTDLESRMKYANEKRVLLEVEVIRLCQMTSEQGDKAMQARLAILEKKLESGVISLSNQQIPPDAVPLNLTQEQPLYEAAKPSAPKKPAATGDLKRVIETWPQIKRKIIKGNPGMYILNMMEIAPAGTDNTLILTSQNAVYLEQLEAKNREKLTLVEKTVQEETGVDVRIRTKDSEPEKPQEVNFDDVLSSIHTDVNFE